MSFKKTIFTFSCCVGWGVNAMAWMWRPEGKWSELILFFHHTGSDGEIQITNLCCQLLYPLSRVADLRQHGTIWVLLWVLWIIGYYAFLLRNQPINKRRLKSDFPTLSFHKIHLVCRVKQLCILTTIIQQVLRNEPRHELTGFTGAGEQPGNSLIWTFIQRQVSVIKGRYSP